MHYPVYVDGTEYGQLNIEKDGLYTEITAECKMTEKIVRLYIFGKGKTAALGTLYPKNGRLYLKKRFSAIDMREFPEDIEYAANVKLENSEEKTETPDENLLWFRTENGNLTAFDGENSLIAIPCSDKLKKGRRIKIDGNNYIVFISKRNLQ